ncbi:MAG: ABC transporter permease [Chitinophagales bacterium]
MSDETNIDINEIKDTGQAVVKSNSDQSYWFNVKRQYRKNKRAVFAMYVVFFLALIAIFADFLANEKPIVCKYEGKISAPVLKGYVVNAGLAKWPKQFQNVEWKDLDYDFAIWPLIPYLPTNLDFKNDRFRGPFEKQNVKSKKWRHRLGTDQLGRDVMSGMIHGTRVAFLVGIVSMTIATLIGILLGSLAGFFGDSELKASRGSLIFAMLSFFPAVFYGFTSRKYDINNFVQFLLGLIIFFGIITLGVFIGKLFSKIPFLSKKVAIPMDIIITRLIEVVVSIPVLVLILAITSILTKPSILYVMVIIGMVSWTGIARFTRAELMRQKRLEYIEASKALGFSRIRSLFRHALPNALSPVFIAVAFGVAASILVEAFLSFLGVGVPPETVTWGQLLSASRKATDAWWLAIFPGFAIFITVTMFNLIGEGLTDALDPRQKR